MVARQRRSECGQVGPGNVADVDEVTSLPTVLEDARGLFPVERAEKDACHAGVGSVERGAGSVDVVVSESDHPGAGFAAEGSAEVFLVHLGGCVDVARVARRLFFDGHRLQIVSACRA
jgi:hypothetical protein